MTTIGFRDNIKEACQFCQNTANAASSNCCQVVSCGNGLGVASIIGVTIGILVTLASVLLCFYCLWKRYVRSRRSNRNAAINERIKTDKCSNNNPSLNSSSYSTDSKTAIHASKNHWTTALSNSISSTCIPSPISLLQDNYQNYQYHEQDDTNLHIVKYAYPPQMDDELALSVGDIIMLALPFDDGWALGYNRTTGLKGAFPMVCVAPLESTVPRFSFLDPTHTSSIPRRMASKSSSSSSSSSSDNIYPSVA